MSVIRKTVKVIVGSIMAVGMLVLLSLSLVIHVWTIVIAFNSSGILGAVITLSLPIIGEIYWFIRIWASSGTVLNRYCLAIIAYVVVLTITAGAMSVFNWIIEDEEPLEL